MPKPRKRVPLTGAYDGLPCRWRDGEAWMLFKGRWSETSAADAATAAALLSAEAYRREYGDLPPLPAAAFRSGKRSPLV
jgi:hypothetical protein